MYTKLDHFYFSAFNLKEKTTEKYILTFPGAKHGQGPRDKLPNFRKILVIKIVQMHHRNVVFETLLLKE